MTPRSSENVPAWWSGWSLICNTMPPRDPNEDDDEDEDEQDEDRREEPVIREPDGDE
jgi:hypothetical protein